MSRTISVSATGTQLEVPMYVVLSFLGLNVIEWKAAGLPVGSS